MRIEKIDTTIINEVQTIRYKDPSVPSETRDNQQWVVSFDFAGDVRQAIIPVIKKHFPDQVEYLNKHKLSKGENENYDASSVFHFLANSISQSLKRYNPFSYTDWNW